MESKKVLGMFAQKTKYRPQVTKGVMLISRDAQYTGTSVCLRKVSRRRDRSRSCRGSGLVNFEQVMSPTPSCFEADHCIDDTERLLVTSE